MRGISLPVDTSRGAIRFAVGYAAIAAAAPYLALKVAWLAGGTVGMADPAFFATPVYIVANLATLGMDAIAVLLALALTHPWGRRLPAWLVLFPMWVATGFLAPIAVILLGAPVAFRAAALASGPLRPWVYALVYGGFAAQGLLLSTAFVLYARDRWVAVLRGHNGDAPPGPTHTLQALLTVVAAATAAAAGALHLAWALGARAGLPAAVLADPPAAHRLTTGVYAAFAFAAAAGLPLLARRARGGGPLLTPLAPTWMGGGSLCAWGGWQLAIMAADPALGTPPLALATAGQALAGSLVGAAMTSLLVGRRDPAPAASS